MFTYKSMLSNSLNTNEIKNSAGAEVEFSRLSTKDRSTVFAKVGESPALPHRLTISHQESGSGLKLRRRSMNRVDITSISDVDSVTPITTSAILILDFPVGASNSTANAANVLAELGSFNFLTGVDSTLLFNGTGNGTTALLSGGL